MAVNCSSQKEVHFIYRKCTGLHKMGIIYVGVVGNLMKETIYLGHIDNKAVGT